MPTARVNALVANGGILPVPRQASRNQKLVPTAAVREGLRRLFGGRGDGR